MVCDEKSQRDKGDGGGIDKMNEILVQFAVAIIGGMIVEMRLAIARYEKRVERVEKNCVLCAANKGETNA